MSIISNIDNKHVTGVKINDEIVANKEVIGTFIKNTGEIEITNINHMYDNLKGQYIDIQGFGTWYVDDLKSDEEFVTSKLSLYDVTTKFDEDYDDSFSFPATMGEWAIWIGNKVGIPLKGTFLNYDLVLNERPYLGNEPKYRDAVKRISKYASSYAQKNYDNTYSIRWFDNETTDIEDWESFVHSNQMSAINVVVLSTGDTEDNVKFPEQNPSNPHELRIEDDWINIDRYSINQAIYNQVNGFFYTPISKLNVPYGLLNLTAGQKIRTQDIEHIDIETYISKVRLEWQGGAFDDANAWTTSIKMEELKETSTKLKYANSFENRVLNVERKADKNAGEISDTIQKLDNQTEKITNMQMTVDGVNISVSDIKKDVSNMQDNLSNVSDNVDNLNNNLNNTNETINQMNYNFSTEALKINSGKDPVNTSINNKGVQVYNYTTLKSVINDKGAGFDDLIVTNTAQLAYLKFMKSVDENGNLCTDIHHLVSNVQKITDLVGED